MKGGCSDENVGKKRNNEGGGTRKMFKCQNGLIFVSQNNDSDIRINLYFVIDFDKNIKCFSLQNHSRNSSDRKLSQQRKQTSLSFKQEENFLFS